MPENMITFEKDRSKFNFRAVGVMIHDNKVLVHRSEMDDFWALPGGRVEFQETSEETLVREMKEELQLDVEVERLLWIAEYFFDSSGKSYHELGFYHLMNLPDKSPIFDEHEEFVGYEQSYRLIFKWIPLNEIESLVLYPAFLKEKLVAISDRIEHIVEREPDDIC